MTIRAIVLAARSWAARPRGATTGAASGASWVRALAGFASVLLLAAGLISARADAAVALEDERGTLVIAGQPMSCRDSRGSTVHTMQVINLGDVGRAGVVNRVPIIVIDPQIIGRLPDKLQIFFYQHECGHHVLGHWYGGNSEQEKEADCWAIKHGRENGTFSRDDVMSFAPFLAASGGSPFGHLPGPQRAKFLLRCFDEPGERLSPAATAAAP